MTLYSKPPPNGDEAMMSNSPTEGTPGANAGGNGGASNGSGAGSFFRGNGANSSGNASHGSSNNNNNSDGGFYRNSKGGEGNRQHPEESGELNFDNFEYPDSPTQKWLADNADLSPLTVLDNINLKTEFPYGNGAQEIDKPPDISHITLDTNAENLLQFSASVPVPDSTATFLDIGTDSFSQSLYDDLGDINLHEFQNVGHGNNNNHHHHHHHNNNNHIVTTYSPTTAMTSTFTELSNMPLVANNTATTPAGSGPKLITLEKLTPAPTPNSINLVGDVMKAKVMDKADLNPLALLPKTPVPSVAQPPSLKNLIEPLPASALKGLIKVEPPPPTAAVYTPTLVKVEQPDLTEEHVSNVSGFSPMSSMGSTSLTSPPHSPESLASHHGVLSHGQVGGQVGQTAGGGKMKGSPSRKKSTSSTDEEDISNIPDLKMRIQIISQRVSVHWHDDWWVGLESTMSDADTTWESLKFHYINPFFESSLIRHGIVSAFASLTT